MRAVPARDVGSRMGMYRIDNSARMSRPTSAITAISTVLLGLSVTFAAAPGASALGAQTTWLVSRTTAAATQPSLSPDGQFVAFRSEGDLVAPDNNAKADIYLSSAAGATPYSDTPVLVSIDANGQAASGVSSEPAVSADGRYVAFASDSNDLVAGSDSAAADIYVRDVRGATTVRIQGAALPNGASSQPAISNDGRYVVFTSLASNLVSGDTNNVSDVFLYDRTNGNLTRVSTSASGAQLTGKSSQATISGNGAAIAFASENHTLGGTPVADAGFTYVWHRTVAGSNVTMTQIGATGRQSTREPSLSGDGQVIAYTSKQPSYNGVSGMGSQDKVFVESVGGNWEWVSDGLGSTASTAPSLSADGSAVAFTSGTTLRVAETESRYGAGGAGSDGVAATVVGPTASSDGSISATGRTTAFASTGTLAGDASDSGKSDIAVVGTVAGDQALHPAIDSINGLRKPAPLPFVDPSRIPAGATYVQPGPATAGSTRIGSTRIGSTRIGSTRIGSTRIGSTRIGSTRIGSTRIGSTRIGSTRIGSTRIGDLPLTQWPLVSQDGWKVLLAGTPFEGLPLASVTLNQVSDWAANNPGHPKAAAITNLTLGDFTPDAPFGALTLISVLLLEKPVADIPVPGDQGTDLANWKAAAAAQGFDPSSVTSTTTLLDLDGNGLDIDLTGVGGARASAVGPAGTSMQWIKVNGLSLDNPLGTVKVGELSAAAASAVVDCSGVADCNNKTLKEIAAAGKIKGAATLSDLAPGLPPGITLDEIVRSLVDPLDFPWEQLSWDSLGAGRYNIPTNPAPGERTGITEVAKFRAGFDTGPGGAAQVRNAVLEVQLPPGTAFHDATITATGPLGYVTPYTPESQDAEQVGDLVRFQLGDVPTGTTMTVSVRSTDSTNYQQDNNLRSVLKSATGQDDATIKLQGYAGYDQLVDPDSGDNPNTAPVLDVPNRIYFGGITPTGQGQPADVDYVKIPRPGPGQRLILASGTVGPQIDIGLFQVTSSDSAPANGGTRDGRGLGASVLLEDDLFGIGAGNLLPSPLNIWDEPGWSLLDSSTHSGTQEELVTLDGDSRGGNVLVKIQSADGIGSLMPYTLRYGYVDIVPEQRCPAYVPEYDNIPLLNGGLTPPVILPGTNTIFLIDQNRLVQEYGALWDWSYLSFIDAGTWIAMALSNLDGQLGLKTAVIPITGLDLLDLHKTSGVVAARSRLDKNPCSVSASNAMSKAIQDLLGTYLTTEQSWADLKNIVLVGGDDQIPFWRLPGGTFGARETDNEAALRLSSPRTNSCDPGTQPGLPCDRFATPLSSAAAGDFVLTDDAYGDIAPVGVLDRNLFVPNVAVARLVETPEDIADQVSTYLNRNGQLQADSALSTGYGAWDEVPARLVDSLLGRTAAGNHQTLNGAWTRNDLTSKLFPSGASPRLVSINAHMTEDALIPGQPGATNATPSTNDLYKTSDLPSDWRSRLRGRLLYTIGCHAGQQLPDAWYGSGNLDFAEAFNTGGYIGNTGWGVADDAATAMSERLLVGIARYLNKPGVTAGQAMMLAKQDYLDGLGLFMGYDEKVLMQATYYGLPMYTLSGAGGSTAPPATGNWTSGSDLGLTTRSSSFVPNFVTKTTPQGNYLTANGQEPVSSPGNPIVARFSEQLPQVSGQTPKDGLVLSLNTSGVGGATAVAAENFGGAALPERVDDIAFPSSLTAVSGQQLTLIASRVDANSTASMTSGLTERFNNVGVRVYYSASSDSTQPFVASSASRNANGSQTITVRARDDGGPTKAAYLMTNTGGPGAWTGTWMTPAGADTYTATIPCGGDVRWFTQVVDGAGNVGIDMKRGYFGQCSAAAPVFEVGMNAQIVENTEFVRITGNITDADSDRFTGTFDFGTGPQEMEIVKGPDGQFRAVVQVAGLHAGTYQVTVTVCDDSGLCTSRTFSLTVTQANTAPQSTVSLNTMNPLPGQLLIASAEGTDADGEAVQLRYQWYLNGTAIPGATSDRLDLDDVAGAQRGDTITVTVIPNDGHVDGGGASASAIIRLNSGPTVDAGPNGNVAEGSAFTSTATVVDPHGDAIASVTVDYGDGTAPVSATPGASVPLSHTYADNGSYTVTVTATDEFGAVGSDTATVTVTNVAPVLVLPSPAPAPPAATGSPTTLTIDWTDPGADSWTVVVNWGDGTSNTYQVPAGSPTLLVVTHTYATASTYVIGVTVTDDDGGSVTESPYDFGAVFDASGGYLSANGHYVSPVGAWPANPAATGQAEFGLQAKVPSSGTPTGKFRFTYDITPLDHGCAAASCLEFDSTSYSSLVITGNKATLKGSGKLNGATGHSFVITVIDGSPDKVRIKIFKGSKVIYDTNPGAVDTADPTIALAGGSVLIKRP